MPKLEDYLIKALGVRPEITNELLTLGHEFQLKPGQRLLQKGDVSKRVYFIETGIVREYEDIIAPQDKDNETTTWILGSGEWIYNVESYHVGEPSEVYIQSLDHSTGLYFERDDLENLVESSHEWALIQNRIYKRYFVRQERRNRLHRTKDGKRRVELFNRQYPDLHGKVKHKHIASYLNLTESQFSRLRSS